MSIPPALSGPKNNLAPSVRAERKRTGEQGHGMRHTHAMSPQRRPGFVSLTFAEFLSVVLVDAYRRTKGKTWMLPRASAPFVASDFQSAKLFKESNPKSPRQRFEHVPVMWLT